MEVATLKKAGEILSSVLTFYEGLKWIVSHFEYKSKLEKLQSDVSQVKAALLDAETKSQPTNQEKILVESLKRVAYDAEDLFDMHMTHCRQQLLNGDNSKFIKKVRDCFSAFNRMKAAYTLRKEADKILNNLPKHEIPIIRNSTLPRSKKCQTDYYLAKDDIIGRENDVESIIVGHHLLNATESVSFLCIVGMGGIGKTALAKLIFNDERVKREFSKKIWICVSDHGQQSLDLEQILSNILSSKKDENLNLGSLKEKVTNLLSKNKFLLVLDDVWTEDRNDWLKLGKLLSEGQKGSWIVVTTRSKLTAKTISNNAKEFILKGLSDDNSWRLFEKKAFDLGGSKSKDNEYIEIGKEIVKGCAGVPLAISVAGSLLYPTELKHWKSIKQRLCNNIGEEESVRCILKFSYDQLELPLKSCFIYCALFPKDFIIIKDIIIRIWMAQGYIDLLNKDETLEDVAEKYLSTLLHRCFFHDLTLDESGKIISFKMHDLMHDLAVAEAGNNICVTVFPSNNALDPNVRHLAYTSGKFTEHSFVESHIRSYTYVGTWHDNPKMDEPDLKALLSNWKRLRALDFHKVSISSLPKSIGRLLHLRYLDLLNKNSELEVLPNSISKLFNLQTLKIGGCQRLKELPQDFSKLVNLRMLEISNCGIQYVTCLGAFPHLHTLTLRWLLELEYFIALPKEGKLRNEEALYSPSKWIHKLKGLSCSTVKEELCSEDFLCCPSLEKLTLWGLKKLKGWSYSRAGDQDGNSSSNMTPLLLPKLKFLEISECHNMTFNMLCPSIEDMRLSDFNEGLQINDKAFVSSNDGIPKLRKIVTDNVTWLNMMPMASFHYLKKLEIDGDKEVVGLNQAKDVFHGCEKSLQCLYIYKCDKLKSVMPGGLQHLNALETLHIQLCKKLIVLEERGAGIEDTISFRDTLRHIKLSNLSRLEELPHWKESLKKLETFEVVDCNGVKAKTPKITFSKSSNEGCSKEFGERCEISVEDPQSSHSIHMHKGKGIVGKPNT